MTGVRRRKRKRRVEEQHFPLLHRLLLIGSEDHKYRPGSLHWEKGGIEVTRSGWCER